MTRGGAMSVRPCVRCATLDGYVGLARSCGLDPARLMAGVGLGVAPLAASPKWMAAAALAVPDKWIPAADVARLLERSASASRLEDFGLRLAALRRLATLGPL